MGRRGRTPPSPEPNIDDFRLTAQQRAFHDAYVDGETKGNFFASAIAAGYSETVAKSRTGDMVPAIGETSESVRAKGKLIQAIYNTLERRRKIQAELERRSAEGEIERGVLTKKKIVDDLLELADRCMGRDKKDNRKLVADILSKAPFKITDAMREWLIDSFLDTCHRYKVFHPAGAKEALKLLGLEISMFQRVAKFTPETEVDEMELHELLAEQDRLGKEFSTITKAIGKKGNGHAKPKTN